MSKLDDMVAEALKGKGTADAGHLPYLRGYVVYGTDPATAARCLDLLVPHDDKRDLLHQADVLIARFGAESLAGKGKLIDERLKGDDHS